MEFRTQQSTVSNSAAPMEPAETKAGRFMSLSIFLHVSILASVALMNSPSLEIQPKEVLEFEVESQVTGVQAIPEGLPVPETKGQTPTSPQPAPAPIPVAARASIPAPAAPAIEEAPAVAPVAAVITEVSETSEPAEVAESVPETLDDIQAPELDTADVSDVKVTQAAINEDDLAEDFEKVDQEHNKALATARSTLDEEVEKVAVANEAALAKAAEQVQAGNGSGSEGAGSGRHGSPEPTKVVAGIPGGVRSLEQLRQMPNNKFPEYSREERFSRQEGQAMFYAYVNKDGSLSQFKLGQSTGYRNLDGKTLAALKKWKFYPGQEGWVELPFKWKLAGEAKQAGGALRKSIK